MQLKLVLKMLVIACYCLIWGCVWDVWGWLGTKINNSCKTTEKKAPAAACVQELKTFQT